MPHPFHYVPDFLNPNLPYFKELLEEIEWERRPDAPRYEAYFNEVAAPYTYGRGAGRRTYLPQPWSPCVLLIKSLVEQAARTHFEAMFANRYDNDHDWLGWHADDSPEMDPARPIVVVSLGGPRDIELRPKGGQTARKISLASGSLLQMDAGMQASWEHRIPKAGRRASPRISLTFRGYIIPPSTPTTDSSEGDAS